LRNSAVIDGAHRKDLRKSAVIDGACRKDLRKAVIDGAYKELSPMRLLQ